MQEEGKGEGKKKRRGVREEGESGKGDERGPRRDDRRSHLSMEG